jgi:co-chaperonin GroES (HSP10)
MMANIPGLGGGVGAQTESPTVKLSMREYEDMNIKVGDKVYFDIYKPDNSNEGV